MNETNTPEPTPIKGSVEATPQVTSSTPALQPNRRPLFIIAAAVAVIILAIIGLLLLNGSTSDTTSASVKRAAYPDYLKPASTLMVGDYRYASACQVFPEASATQIFGKLIGQSVVREEYIDQSQPNTTDGAEADTECVYNSVEGDGHLITMSLKQYGSADQASADNLVDQFPGESDANAFDKKLSSLEKAPGLSGNKDATDFVNKLKSSVARYKKVANFESTSATALDGVIVPDPDKADGTNFVGVHKNIVYTISFDKGTGKLPSTTDQLARMAKAVAVIQHNLGNSTLSQSPSPTVRGDTITSGSTRVLEPCYALDGATFQAVLAVPENQPVQRTSLPLDIKSVFTRQDKTHSVITPQNECQRSYFANPLNSDDSAQLTAAEQRYGIGGNASIDLQLEYPRDHAAADKEWAEYTSGATATDPTNKTLATDADRAVLTTGGSPDSQIAYFRVGNYIGTVTFIENHSDEAFDTGDALAADDASFVTLINHLTANLKAAQK